MLKSKYDNVPFRPKRWPFFYGWFILFAAIIGSLASVPGQTFGVSAFTEPLLNALHIDRMRLSLAYMVGTIGSAFILTWGGKTYDWFGARTTAFAAALGLGGILFFLSSIDDVTRTLGQILGEGARSWIAFATITIGFLVLRFCGQGMLTMVSRNMLMKWFDHKRGLASGFMGTVIALVFSATPYVFDTMIEAYGWRTSWLLMGVVMVAGVATFILIFFRDNPENCGLQPDGGLQADPNDPQHDPDHDYTLPEARRTPDFWIYNLTVALYALYFTAFTFHVVSIFEQVGIGKSDAFAIFIPASVIAVAGRMTLGWLSDHIRLWYLLLVLAGGMAVSMTGVILLNTPVGYYMIIAGNGAAGAVFGLLSTITWPRLFGRTHLGAISGFHMSWVVGFSAVGPFLFGSSLKYLDNYFIATAGCLGFLLCVSMAGLKFRVIGK